MPYKSPEEVAEKVRGAEKLSDRKRRQFQHVFNSCWERNPGDEAKCHAQAWSAVKKSARETPLVDFANVGPRAVKAIKKLLGDFGESLERMTDNLKDADKGIAIAIVNFEDDLDDARRYRDELLRVLGGIERSWKAVEQEAEKRRERLTEGFRPYVSHDAVARELVRVARLCHADEEVSFQQAIDDRLYPFEWMRDAIPIIMQAQGVNMRGWKDKKRNDTDGTISALMPMSRESVWELVIVGRVAGGKYAIDVTYAPVGGFGEHETFNFRLSDDVASSFNKAAKAIAKIVKRNT